MKKNDTAVRYLKNYDNLPIIIKHKDEGIEISFVNNTKFSDKEIYKAVKKIIQKELDEFIDLY